MKFIRFKKKERNKSSHTIKGKIQLQSIFTVGLALAILGTVSTVLSYTNSVSILKETMSQTASVAANQVKYQIQAIENVASDTGAMSRLSSSTSTQEDKQKIITQKIKQYNFQKGDILSTSGSSILGNTTSYKDKDWFKTAMKGETCITAPDVDSKSGDITIIVAAPLWADGMPNTTVTGVVYFVTGQTFLNDIVSTIKVSANSTTFITDSTGTCVANVNMDTVKTKNNSIELSKTDSSFKSLASVVSNIIKGESGFDQYTYKGTTKFLAYAPIGGTDGWSICVNAPTSDFLGSTVMSMMISLGVLVIALAAAVFVSLKLANRIGKPVKLCVDRIGLMAQGDLKSPMPNITSNDETALLAQATEEHLRSLNCIISDLDYTIREIAAGNFNVRSKVIESYVGDFSSLILTLRTLVIELSSTMAQINGASDQVAAGAEQLAAAATNLSHGATEQASSIEELAATISEISSQTNQNAKNAETAGTEVEALGEELRSSNNQMKLLIQAMDEIGDASNEISKIIKAIEDIAFQTNILALNAAVEAARAGQAGKGFAVVADEVRNLAGKSAQAANNTTALIESAIRAIGDGTRLVGDTGTSLENVVQRAEKVVSTVKMISDASASQADAVNQVTVGIEQISSVVQINSSTAEESAATSEELSSQSQLLKNLVSQFKLREEK